MNPSISKKIHYWLGRLNVSIRRRIYSPHSQDRFVYEDIIQSLPAGERPVIFDVGANIGQTAIAFNLSIPEAEIHSFEPFSQTFETLQKYATPLTNVHCWQVALSATAGVLHVPQTEIEANSVMNSLTSAKTDDSPDAEAITVSTVDDFCLEHRIKKIDLLKIDTEGFDLEVLKGAKEMLSQGNISSVLIETSLAPTSSRHVKFSEIEAFLDPYGLKFFGLYDANSIPPHGQHYYFNALFKQKN